MARICHACTLAPPTSSERLQVAQWSAVALGQTSCISGWRPIFSPIELPSPAAPAHSTGHNQPALRLRSQSATT